MKKIIVMILGVLFALSLNIAFADNECDSTWNNSSAAGSCGYVCTNPENVEHFPFNTTYNPEKNECTFDAGCCQGLPYQICSYQWAVCSHTVITVKRGDSNFSNDHGQFVHG